MNQPSIRHLHQGQWHFTDTDGFQLIITRSNYPHFWAWLHFTIDTLDRVMSLENVKRQNELLKILLQLIQYFGQDIERWTEHSDELVALYAQKKCGLSSRRSSN